METFAAVVWVLMGIGFAIDLPLILIYGRDVWGNDGSGSQRFPSR